MFGEIAFTYTIVSSVATIVLLGVHDGVTRKMSGERGSLSKEEIVQSGLIIVLFSASISSIVLYLLRNWIAQIAGIMAVSTFLVLFIPYIFLYPLGRISLGILRAQKQSFPAVISQDFISRLGSIGILLALTLTGENVLGAIVYWLSVPLLLVLGASIFIRKNLDLTNISHHTPSVTSVRELWRFSWPLAGGLAIFLFLRNLDILMIGYFMDETSVGYYRSIQPLQQISTFILGSFTFIFLPLATKYYDRGMKEELNHLYNASTKWILLATTPPVLLFSFFSSDIIRIVYGEAYLSAATALSVLVGGLLIRAVTGLNGDVVQAIDQPRIELYSAAVGLCFNFIFNILLIPVFGIVGAAFSTVMGYAVYNIVETGAIYRETGITPFALSNIKPIIPTAGFAASLALLTQNQLSIPEMVLVGLSLGIIQILSLFLTRSVEEDDLILFDMFEDKIGFEMERTREFLRKQI